MRKADSQIIWDAWGETHPGRQRGTNEDRIFCDPDRGIFVVADGMGGEAAGEVAAEQAVQSIRDRLSADTGTLARRLREAVAAANNEIYRLAQRNPAWRGMACVVTAAAVENETLHVAHVGDTRLYQIHHGAIRKLTSDHSPIGKREEAGELTELEAMRHPRRNEVYRDVGSRPHKPDDDDFVEYARHSFEPDSAIVLCSDGLSDLVTSTRILEIVEANAGNPRAAARALIEAANEAGGKDNVSAIVAEGDGFRRRVRSAAAKPSTRGVGAAAETHAPVKTIAAGVWFASRWAFLLYGIVIGLFLWNFAARFFTGTPEAPPQDPRPPAVLVVAPESPEFPTIGKALDSARPGDRVEVSRGEYFEALSLKEGVDVVARVPGSVVLNISRPLPGTEAAIKADGVARASLSGIAVRASAAAALPFGMHLSNSHIEVSNVEISGATRAGVFIEGGSHGTLSGSYIHSNSGPGIVVAGTASPHIVGNLVYRNGVRAQRASPGLVVTGEANPEVSRNVFSGNGAEGVRIPRAELKTRMIENLFLPPGRPGKAIVVDSAR